jgi:hypothetical protein
MPAVPVPPTPQLFTLEQVAGPVLPCTERFVADKLRAGLWPGRKVGRKWVLTDEDLSKIISICSVNPMDAQPIGTASSQAPQGNSSMTLTTARRLRGGGRAKG